LGKPPQAAAAAFAAAVQKEFFKGIFCIFLRESVGAKASTNIANRLEHNPDFG